MMTRPIGLAIAIGLVLVGGALAKKSATGGIVTTAPSTAFEQADKNRDGSIDHAEYYDCQVDVFFLIDVDKDGYVTITELGEVDQDTFVRADRDKDGKLSIREFTAARFKDFDGADTDDDEVLTMTEIDASAKNAGEEEEIARRGGVVARAEARPHGLGGATRQPATRTPDRPGLHRRRGSKARHLEDLPLTERLARQQRIDERVELLAMSPQKTLGLLVALVEDPAYFLVDGVRGLFAVGLRAVEPHDPG
jgi:hypothetical protein